MPQPRLAGPAMALLTLALALAACGPGPARPAEEGIQRGTALPPPGLEVPLARR